ncbi:MAG: hypothetical protein HYZ37_09060 [Candidatus Solibacter usitatus]|nr:hypothetical protein [Candidatus Solibacter usitatus]
MTISRRNALRLLPGLGLAASAGAESMRITRYELMPVRVPMHPRLREAWTASWSKQKRDQTSFTPIFVRLHTDAGITGIGETKMPKPQAEAVLKKMIGRSPLEFLSDDSIRGILIAIYDLLGKAAGLPVSRLLSPQPKDRIVQTWWSQCFPPDVMASEAKLGASLGYRLHKIKIRPWQDPIDQAAAIAAVVPPDFRIWADANAWWGAANQWDDRSHWARSLDGALRVLRGLSRFPNFFGLESPFARQEFDTYRQLKGKTSFRISEHIDGSDPMPWIREGLLDAFIVGGPRLGETFTRLASLAHSTGVPLWVEHSTDAGIAQVFQAHQAAAFPGV